MDEKRRRIDEKEASCTEYYANYHPSCRGGVMDRERTNCYDY